MKSNFGSPTKSEVAPATSLESQIVPLLVVTVTIARATTVTRRPAAPLAPHVAARVRSGGHGGGFTSAYRTPAYGEHATALPELGKHGKCAPVRCWRASGCKPVTRANVLRSEIIRSRETGVYAGYSARRPDAVFHSTMFDEVMDEFAAKVAGLTDGDVWHACDNCAEQHRHAPSRTRRSRVRVGGASPDHHWRGAARGVPDLGWVRSTSRCTSFSGPFSVVLARTG